MWRSDLRWLCAPCLVWHPAPLTLTWEIWLSRNKCQMSTRLLSPSHEGWDCLITGQVSDVRVSEWPGPPPCHSHTDVCDIIINTLTWGSPGRSHSELLYGEIIGSFYHYEFQLSSSMNAIISCITWVIYGMFTSSWCNYEIWHQPGLQAFYVSEMLICQSIWLFEDKCFSF